MENSFHLAIVLNLNDLSSEIRFRFPVERKEFTKLSPFIKDLKNIARVILNTEAVLLV